MKLFFRSPLAKTINQPTESNSVVNNFLNVRHMNKFNFDKAAKAAKEAVAMAAVRETEKSLCVVGEITNSLTKAISNGLKIEYAPPAKAWKKALEASEKEDFHRILAESREAYNWEHVTLSSEEVENASLILDIKMKDGKEKFISLGNSGFYTPSFHLLEDCEIKRMNGSRHHKGKLGKKNITRFHRTYGHGAAKGYGKLSETGHSLVTHVCSPKSIGLEHFDRVDEFNRQARQKYIETIGRDKSWCLPTNWSDIYATDDVPFEGQDVA